MGVCKEAGVRCLRALSMCGHLRPWFTVLFLLNRHISADLEANSIARITQEQNLHKEYNHTVATYLFYHVRFQESEAPPWLWDVRGSNSFIETICVIAEEHGV